MSNYEKKIMSMGIELDSIIDIEEVRTYKKFLNVIITYKSKDGVIKKNFKAISKKKDLDEDYR